MKKALAVVLFAATTLLSSCESSELESTRVSETEKGGEVHERYDGFISINIRTELHEMDYKGHVYVYCHVKNGIAMTHAGHCPCNSK